MPTSSIVAIFLLFIVDIANYSVFSYSKSARYDSLGYQVSIASNKSKSKSINLSFTNKEEIDNKQFQEFANYCYSQSYNNVDINGYDYRFTLNSNSRSNKVNYLDTLGNEKAGLVCRNMDFTVKTVNDVDYYVSNQTGLYFEFPRKGSTQSDFKEGVTNFIYLRYSDAELLTKMEGTPFYGLTHEELLGKGIDVEVTYQDKVVVDKWKIDNFILETIDGKTESNHKHLTELYGDYFLTSMYGHQLFLGCSIDFELSTSSSSNTRNIKKGINKFGVSDFDIGFSSNDSKIQNEILTADSMLKKLLKTKDNDVTMLSVCIAYSIVYLVGAYFMFAKSKEFRLQNLILIVLSFVLSYSFIYVMKEISMARYGLFFNEFAVLASFLITLMAIALMYISSMDDKKEEMIKEKAGPETAEEKNEQD